MLGNGISGSGRWVPKVVAGVGVFVSEYDSMECPGRGMRDKGLGWVGISRDGCSLYIIFLFFFSARVVVISNEREGLQQGVG